MRIIASCVAFAAGLIIGEAGALAVYIARTELFGIFDREGAEGMMMAFFVGPAAGALIGLLLAALAWRLFDPARSGAR